MNNNYHRELLEIFADEGGYFNEKLTIKKDLEKGYSVIAKENIEEGTLLIDVPKNLLIPLEKVKNLNNFNNKFEEIYFKTINSNFEYLNHHPLKSNNQELDRIYNTIGNNKNLYKNFLIKYKNFNLLSEQDKKINLLSKTRAINLNKFKKKFFMPVMDLVNYNYAGLTYKMGEKGNIYIKSKNIIKKSEEIYVNYTSSSINAITFFFEHGFIDSSFNSFEIKGGELKFNQKNIYKYDKKYFSSDGGTYTFKEDINFTNNNISNNFIKLLEIFPPDQRYAAAIKILSMYKNLMSPNKDQNYNENSIIIKNFNKSVELYINIIDNYLGLIKRNYEKN